MNIERPLSSAITLGAGVALAGIFVGLGFARGRQAARYVTVKGVAEQDVQADLALWPLRLVVAGDDLQAAYARINAEGRLVRAFLHQNDIDTTQVDVQQFSVDDADANQDASTDRGRKRFVIRETIMVRSTDPGRVMLASQRVGELVEAGVVLSSGQEYGAGGPTFVFTGLNALKPRMIGDATKRAREAATQFAIDSRSELGGIRQADQGIFEILPRDQAPGVQEESQLQKKVRVVTTVQYFLTD